MSTAAPEPPVEGEAADAQADETAEAAEPAEDGADAPVVQDDGVTVQGEAAQGEDGEREWWDDPGMPWRQKPERADFACLAWFGAVGVFNLVMLPMRAWLIAASPAVLAMLTGSRSAVAASGALASVGEMPSWIGVLIVASVLSLKFDWVFWWAGKLWGRGMIEVWAGQSKRSAKRFATAERWAARLGPLGMFVAYIPIPLPLMQVIFVLFGASGMSLKRFLILDYLASTVWLIGYFSLGWFVGETAVGLLDAYARIAMWVTFGLLAFVIATAVISARKRQRARG